MSLRLALAQINVTVGDVSGNGRRIVAAALEARDRGADAILFPELVISGYPPEDLVLRQDFLEACRLEVAAVAAEVQGITLIMGFPEAVAGARPANSAAVWRDGVCLAHYRKQSLPNYGVFDEARHFSPGQDAAVFTLNGMMTGLTICEDIWVDGPVEQAVAAGARLILNLNASPWHQGKQAERVAVAAQRCCHGGVPMAYVNLVGGQDELVFDGHSFVVSADGHCPWRAPGFTEGIYYVDMDSGADGRVQIVATPDESAVVDDQSEDVLLGEIYAALVLGIRDYVRKNGFDGAVLGLSGGIDSALTLALAADALGPEQVVAVLMPSRYTQSMSIEDAISEADALGCRWYQLPIEAPFQAFTDLLAQPLAGWPEDLTEENLQARCRGVLLMAIANKQKRMLLTTGNKSEMSVGYATLYGDMAGALAPLKDVFKLLVYRLAAWRNRQSLVIPVRVMERPPSAELRPDQRDDDSLPPYPVLDAILAAYVEADESVADMMARGLPAVDIQRVVQLVDRSEFKRRQSPPGIRITRRALGRERRYPMTNGFRPGDW